jgi:hypothetical protein
MNKQLFLYIERNLSNARTEPINYLQFSYYEAE